MSARFCTAVGSTDENVGPTAGTSAMGWDGRRWRIEPTPDPDPANDALRADNALAGVSCTSSKLCVAVGEYNPSSFSPDGIHTVPVVMPVAERWNGVRWSMLTFPSLPSGAPAGGLSAVSCTSSRVCMAVGSSTDFSPLIVFAERWDGTSWSVQSTPNAPGEYNDLSVSRALPVAPARPSATPITNNRWWSAGTAPAGHSSARPTQVALGLRPCPARRARSARPSATPSEATTWPSSQPRPAQS